MESLSDYMLLEIFTRLDPKSLRNCTEVCKRWDKLISQSTSTMSNLTLNVGRSNKLRDLRHFSRRYLNMKLFRMTIGLKTWSLLLDYQPSLCKLELNQISITKTNYVKILRSIPTLQELTIIDCSLRSENDGEVELVKMPMLRKLTINVVFESVGFIDNIDGSALKKLEISYQHPYHHSHLFISSMQNLEDLTVNTYRIVDNLCYVAPEAQLKNLKMSFWTDWRYITIRECGYSLVKAHTSTLETLEIKPYFNPEVTDYDLTNVAPFNSLSTGSFEEFYGILVDVYSTNYSPELIASTAKYYFPQLKSMKIFRPRSA